MVTFWTFSFLDFLADLLQKSISVASNLFACCVFINRLRNFVPKVVSDRDVSGWQSLNLQHVGSVMHRENLILVHGERKIWYTEPPDNSLLFLDVTWCSGKKLWRQYIS
jgi:hypothetical protein